MAAYRDDIDAARARIAQLEAEVEELRGALARTPELRARLAQLEQRRADAFERLRAQRASARTAFRIAVAVVVAAGLAFVGTIASLGASGHPLNAAIVATIVGAPLIAIAWLFVRRGVEACEEDVRAVERQVGEALALETAVRVEAPGVRIAASPMEEGIEKEPSEQPLAKRA